MTNTHPITEMLFTVTEWYGSEDDGQLCGATIQYAEDEFGPCDDPAIFVVEVAASGCVIPVELCEIHGGLLGLRYPVSG